MSARRLHENRISLPIKPFMFTVNAEILTMEFSEKVSFAKYVSFNHVTFLSKEWVYNDENRD
jgi:hypothetical protein